MDRSVVQGIQEDNPEAAVYAFQFPLRFTGTNQLHDNTGGGLSATSSVVKVDGTLLVHNNTANYGGGIHLEDHSLVGLCVCVCACGMVMFLHAHARIILLHGEGVYNMCARVFVFMLHELP